MKRTAALFAAMLATGCASIRTYSEIAPDTNLRQYKTYAWVPVDNTPERPQSILDQDIQSALRRELAAKGLVEATAGPPDFLIGYHFLRDHKVAVTDWGNGLYGWLPEVRSYNEGTMIVHFIDPKANRVFWFGSATSAIEHPGVVNLRRLNKAVAAIVSRYPSSAPASHPPKQ
jgi:hypothetical protein